MQLLYAAMGITFNVVSIVLLRHGAAGLTPTSPYAGIIVLAVYAISVLFSRRWRSIPRRLLLGFWFLILGYGGVITHVLNGSDLQHYHSTAAWVAAIGTNAFGVVVNVCAFFARHPNEA